MIPYLAMLSVFFAVLNTLFVSSDAQIRPGQNIAHWCFSFCFPLCTLQWPAPLCCFLYFERSPQPRKTTRLKYDKPLLAVPYHQPPWQFTVPPPPPLPADRRSPNWANHAAVKRSISYCIPEEHRPHTTTILDRIKDEPSTHHFWVEGGV